MLAKFKDDKFIHLKDDVSKLRVKGRMFISSSNEAGAKSVVLEIIYNAIDECRNPRSPGNAVKIIYDEKTDTIQVDDNGRGIPTDVMELLFTTLNSGSNIDPTAKNDLKTDTLGRNGVGTLAINAMGENTIVKSYRGGTEGKFKILSFHEGKKVSEENGKCPDNKHGLSVIYKPSKVLGRKTRIVWKMIHDELVNIQFLNKKKIKISSIYIDKDGKEVKEEYKVQPFENILLLRNDPKTLLTSKNLIQFKSDDYVEEMEGVDNVKRFIDMEIAFAFTNNATNPYIDSFCNSNNTFDNGSHLDGALEGLCRYFQTATKNALSERDKLDIKWDDVKFGLSIVVHLRTNMEQLFTNQSKHKVSNPELEKFIKDQTIEALTAYFKNNPQGLKECISIVKANARARREGDKTRQAVIKETLTNWSSFRMKNYDPCTNKGKEYKELFIVEGDSAKGSLKLSRDPRFQALYGIRGVSANVFKLTLDRIVGPNGNKEFNDLVKIMGCNVGAKFDMDKLQFNRIIIASDADK